MGSTPTTRSSPAFETTAADGHRELVGAEVSISPDMDTYYVSTATYSLTWASWSSSLNKNCPVRH